MYDTYLGRTRQRLLSAWHRAFGPGMNNDADWSSYCPSTVGLDVILHPGAMMLQGTYTAARSRLFYTTWKKMELTSNLEEDAIMS